MPSPYFLYLLNTMVSETLHVSSSHSEHARGVALLKNKREPKLIDQHVGNRVRLRRLIMGWSQSKLGNVLGVSFQQVQKYEKGTNRIAASRLQNIAEILEVPVAFFFEGLQRFKDTASAHRPSKIACPAASSPESSRQVRSSTIRRGQRRCFSTLRPSMVA